TAAVSCKQAFGEPIIATVASRDNAEATASAQFDYRQRVLDFTVTALKNGVAAAAIDFSNGGNVYTFTYDKVLSTIYTIADTTQLDVSAEYANDFSSLIDSCDIVNEDRPSMNVNVCCGVLVASNPNFTASAKGVARVMKSSGDGSNPPSYVNLYGQGLNMVCTAITGYSGNVVKFTANIEGVQVVKYIGKGTVDFSVAVESVSVSTGNIVF
ncbi:MAG: hypothetical protein RR389_07075, partial [Christensenella sp.]